MRLLTTLLLLLPLSVFAQVNLNTEVFLVAPVTQADGSVVEEWQDAETIAPGDKIGYRITYTNTGSEAVSGVVINNPVPENTTYVANSANGQAATVTYSVDGELFARMQDLKVDEDGQLRPARAQDINQIRWVLQQAVAAGKSGSVEFKVRVN